MPDLQVNSIEDFQAQMNSIMTNADSTLRHEDGVRYDQAVVQTARASLSGVADLQERGLVVPLGNMGVMLSVYERSGILRGPHVSMDGNAKGENDLLTFDSVTVPVPIFSVAWHMSARQLLASRQSGTPLDTTYVQAATRSVAEGLEDCLFNGLGNFSVGGNKVYGYTTHPDRAAVQLSGSGWANPTGRDILGDVKNMLDAAYMANRRGPFILYVAQDVLTELEMDYSANKGDRTFKERIEAFENISKVKASASLANGHVTLVQMTSDVIDLAVAQDIVNVPTKETKFSHDYMVFGCFVPRVKSDKSGSCGVVHGWV